MDLLEDGEFKKSYTKFKYIVKRWEKKFRAEHSRIPSKYDIKEADEKVRKAYASYYELKTQVLERELDGLIPATPQSFQSRLSDSPPSQSTAVESPLCNDTSVPSPENSCRLPSVFEIEQLVNKSRSDDNNTESNNVWGKHLNNKTSTSKTTEKHKPISNTPKVTQNLFKSWSFNKRNPRKLNSSKNASSLDLSQNSSFSETINSNTTKEIESSQSLPGSSGTSGKNVSEPDVPSLPKNLINTLTPTFSSRNVDLNWLDRCEEKLTPNEDVRIPFARLDVDGEEIKKPASRNFGLKNLSVTSSLNVTHADFIEDSESESELTQNCKPIIKKRKVEEIPSNDSIEVESPVKPKRKRAAKKPKTTKAKKQQLEEKPEEKIEEFDLVSGTIEMPRLIINPSILKKPNLVDGLTDAIKLPKNYKTLRKTESDDDDSAMDRKIKDGTLNDNFVRINIEKKVYARGKKSKNYSKYKKQQWKNKKKALNELGPEFPSGGILKCFKCNQTGHLSRYCRAHKGGELLPLESVNGSDHLTLDEAENTNQPSNINNSDFESIKLPDVDEILDNLKPNTRTDVIPESFLKLLEKPVGNTNQKEVINPVYPLSSEGQLIETPDEVRLALKQFGYSEFRTGQEEAIMRILSGQSTLVTLSTGSGKSLCYQLPAYIYAQHNKCITLVISPLVSLMEDQVSNMPSFLHAGCLHTNQTEVQRQKIIELIKEGKIDVLLISPEAVVSGERSTGFGGLLRQLPPIAFACIDEVHCVSQWSHNFRPSYLMICRVLREKLGVKCILGLTATATATTTNGIIEHIGIEDGINGVITNIPIPKNLILTVSSDNQRDAAIIELLQSERFKQCNSVIVYCIRRDECERIAVLIRTSLQTNAAPPPKQTRKRKRNNWFAEAYHAGMTAAKRRRVQEAFMSGELKIVVATVAFGMGIDKSDIRGVVHFNMPSSFESYVQEVGRAGRDGLPAQCHVFIARDNRDKYELLRHIHANSIERHVIRKLLQKIFIPCSCKDIKTKNNPNGDDTSCKGHEVAFGIDETVQELDLPAENIHTLLCYLELHPNKYIKVLSNAYMYCKIISYGGMATLMKTAQKCPPLAMAIALEKKKHKELKQSNIFEFPVIDVAAALGWESGNVKYHLKKLEWTTENGRPKRSMLKIEFNTLGFRIMAPGDLDSTRLDGALDSLYERTQFQERTKLSQLHEISKTLSDLSYKTIDDCKASDEHAYDERSNSLKLYIKEYFQRESITDKFECTDDKPINEDAVRMNIQGLISAYKDCSFTGKAIARILQGISSPNFPAIVWGRCRFWRTHINDDFHKLAEIARNQIISMR